MHVYARLDIGSPVPKYSASEASLVYTLPVRIDRMNLRNVSMDDLNCGISSIHPGMFLNIFYAVVIDRSQIIIN